MKNSVFFYIGLLAFALSFAGCEPAETEFGAWKCGAEALGADDASVFSNTETIVFGGGGSQSDDRSFNGKFCSKVDEKQTAGLVFTVFKAKPGAWIVASVWKYRGSRNAVLVFSDANENKALLQVSNASQVDEAAGWELLQLKWRVPFKAEASDQEPIDVRIAVQNVGDGAAWFDDLHISYSEEEPEKNTTPLADFNLEFEPRAWQRIKDFRDTALAHDIISSKEKKYVKANLVIDGKLVPVRVRLKGDWTDHLKTDKWSFRIKMRGQYSWNGMRSFSIQSPHTRSYLDEWLVHELYDYEDVLTTRYGFVNVKIDSNALGVYAYEEHFDKQLVESNNRREGPILKYDESSFWASKRYISDWRLKGVEVSPQLPFFGRSDVLPFKQNRTLKNPVLKAEFGIAQSLLLALKFAHDGAVLAIDVNQWAKYYALTDLACAPHGAVWHNKRFYYNPVLSKLEPIAYDCYSAARRHEVYLPYLLDSAVISQPDMFSELALFNDEAFTKLYVKYLTKYSDEAYVVKFMKSIEHEREQYHHALTTELDSFPYSDSLYFQSARSIRVKLKLLTAKLEKTLVWFALGTQAPYDTTEVPLKGQGLKCSLGAVSSKDSTRSSLTLLNYYPKKIEVIGYGSKLSRIHKLNKPFALSGFGNGRWVRPSTLVVDEPKVPKKLFYRVIGQSEIYSVAILPWQIQGSGMPGKALFMNQVFKYSNLFEVSGKTVLFNSGRLVTTADIIIPVGYTVEINSGTEIVLDEGAKFISKSPVTITGTAAKPVVISSDDGTGMGLAVLQADGSSLRHVVFRNLNTLNYEGWMLTGAVTFYESDVNIEDCKFLDGRCEDGLNIIRSEFVINNCLFENTFSDALDIDFGGGVISECQFIAAGNDAIDCSGSRVLIEDVTISKPGDKGISGGEHSYLTLNNVEISDAGMGVVAKDLSEIFASNIRFSNVELGYTAFQKKPEFGPAKIFVMQSNGAVAGSVDVALLHLIETGSMLTLGSDTISGAQDVSDMGWYD
jgi:hypothetical protein